MKSIINVITLLAIVYLVSSCKEDSSPTDSTNQKPNFESLQIELNSEEKTIVDELNKFINPINGADPNTDNSDLKVFDQFSTAKVIGLGEATHGTKEFFQMKHRIFKYFVQKHGFRIFGFEADMGECIYIDRFITKGIGSINDVMNKMHFWTWKTEEVKNLILWMRDYNNSRSETNQIHLLGVDCQYVNYNKALIGEYLSNFDPNYPEYINNILSIMEKTTYQAVSKMTDIDYNTLRKRFDSVYVYLENNKTKLSGQSGLFEYNLINRLAKQSTQFLDVASGKTSNTRDSYMAENTIWLTQLLSSNTKVVSWAHNGHVAKNELYTGTGSQGYHLKQKLNDDYKVIGFSFNTGSFRAVTYHSVSNSYGGVQEQFINRLPPRESTNYIFYALNMKNFILVNSSLAGSEKGYNWLNTSRNFLSIGAVYAYDIASNYFYPQNLITLFDAIIHFRTTSAAIAYM